MKSIEEVRKELAEMGIDTAAAKAKVLAACRQRKPTGLRLLWQWFRARVLRRADAVCLMSVGKGMADYHDYPDSTTPEPWHFFEHTCKRCGKKFGI